MIRVIVFTLVITAIVSAGSSAQAQISVEKSIQPSWVFRGKVTLDFADFNQTYTTGSVLASNTETALDFTGIGANASYFFNDNVAVQFDISYLKSSTLDYSLTQGSTTRSTSGQVTMIPSSVLLQYHIAPYGEIRPYVGAGAAYYYINGNGFDGIDFEDSFGGQLQFGFDWWFQKDFGLNVELKKSWVEANIDYTEFAGFPLISEVAYDPFTLAVGLSYQF